MAKKIGAKIVLEGESEYKQAIANINAAQKELRSELKLVESQFAGQQNTLEALTAEHEVLQKQVEAQTQKLGQYQTMLGAATKAHEEWGGKVDAVSDQLDAARSALDEMTASGQASEEEINAQQAVVAELEAQLKAAESAYDQTGSAVTNYQTMCNNAESDLNSLNSKLTENEKYMDEAKTSTDGCATSIDEYGKKVSDASEKTEELGKQSHSSKDAIFSMVASDALFAGLEKLANLLKEAGEGLVDLGTSAAYQADEIATLSVQYGVATDTIQALQYSEELLDVSLDTVLTSLRKNTTAMGNAAEGTADYVDAYDTLGVSIYDTNDELRNSEDVFWDCIDALGEIENATERDNISMTLFGKKAQTLNPLISAGSEGFRELASEASDLGYILDTETLDGLLDVSDSLERASKYMDTLKKEIGVQVAPTIEAALEKIVGAVQKNEDSIMSLCNGAINALTGALTWILNNADKIVGFAKTIGAAFAAYKGYTIILSAYNAAQEVMAMRAEAAAAGSWADVAAKAAEAVATGTATAAQTALNTAMSVNPALLLVAAIAALAAGLTILSANQCDASDAANQTADSLNSATDAAKENAAAYEDQKASIDESVASTQTLVDRLEELSAKENKTAADKEEIAQIVAKLNDAIPGLSLSYDDLTDSLSMTNAELEKQVRIAADAESYTAAIERRTQIYSDQAVLANTLSTAQAELTAAQEEYVRLSADFDAAYSSDTTDTLLLSTALQSAAESVRVLTDAVENATESQASLDAELLEVNQTILDYEIAQSSVGSAVKSTRNALYEQAAALADTEAQQTAIAALQSLDEEYLATRDSCQTAIDTVRAKMDELQAKMDEAEENISANLDEVCSGFENVAEISVTSVEDMIAGLESQLAYMDSYQANLDAVLQYCEDAGIEMTDTLLAELTDGSTESAAILQALVDDGGEHIADLNEKFAQVSQGKESMVSNLAEIQTNFNDTFYSIQDEMEDAIADMNMADSAYGAALDTAQGYIDGIDDQETSVGEAIKGLGDAILNKFKSILGIASPSKEFKEFGKQTVKGFIEGAENQDTDLQNKMSDMAKAAANGFKGEVTSTSFETIGKNAVQGAINGAASLTSSLTSKFKNLANNAASAFKTALGIASPSKVFAELGEFTVRGAIQGVDENTDQLIQAYQDLAVEAADGYKSASLAAQASLDASSPVISSEVIAAMDDSPLVSALGSVDTTEVRDMIVSVYGLLSEYLPALAERQLVLDSGKMVGELAVPMDKAMAKLSRKSTRGVT